MRLAGLLLLLAWVGVSEASKAGAARLAAMRQLAENQTVVTLTGEQYIKYVLNGPRPYTVLSLYTARNPRYKCQYCQQGQRALLLASHSYRAAEQATDNRTVFFVLTDIDQAKEAFQAHGLQTAPVVSLHPPTKKKHLVSLGNGLRGQYPLHDNHTLHPERESGGMKIFGPDDVLQLLRSRGEAESVKVLWPAEDLRFVMTAVTSFFAGVVATWIACGPTGRFACLRTAVWLLSLSVYVVATAGIIFGILQGSPWLGIDEAGKPTLFASSSSFQYFGEGLLMAALNVGVALALIGLIQVTRKARSELTIVLVGAIALGVAVALLTRISQLYAEKTRWYSPASLIPESWLRITLRGWTLFRTFARTKLGVTLPEWK